LLSVLQHWQSFLCWRMMPSLNAAGAEAAVSAAAAASRAPASGVAAWDSVAGLWDSVEGLWDSVAGLWDSVVPASASARAASRPFAPALDAPA